MHTPTEQQAAPGESTDANIYEQMWQGVDVEAQYILRIDTLNRKLLENQC
jgi:hypothetical protein